MSFNSYYLSILFIIFFFVWVWSGIKPLHRKAWVLENVLLFIFVPLLILSVKYFPLTLVSYTLIGIFFILHAIGSHYTYTLTPVGKTVGKVFGTKRNMYDRLVHFSYGLLLTYPLLEITLKLNITNGLWAYYIPLSFVVATSGIYEIIEWTVVEVADKKAGTSFLGAQGDEWDAQKDMAVAVLGSVITTIIAYFFFL